jgi:hypothetical protein
MASGQVSPKPEDQQDQSGDDDVDAEIGSTGSLDVVDLDTDRDDTRATGHMGKSSSVTWAKRTAEECEETTQEELLATSHETGMTLVSYHTEDADVELFDTTNVNAFDWPDPDEADELVRIFFDHVYPTQPLLDRSSFMARYAQFPRGSNNLSHDDLIWLGTLNVVFAIGAVYCHLTKIHAGGTPFDHLQYLARAKLLCLDQGLLYEDARVATISALGLICLYFVTTCRLNRYVVVCNDLSVPQLFRRNGCRSFIH